MLSIAERSFIISTAFYKLDPLYPSPPLPLPPPPLPPSTPPPPLLPPLPLPPPPLPPSPPQDVVEIIVENARG